MFVRRGLVPLVLASLCIATSAFGQEASDVVRLKNGSMMRGTIVDLMVGDHVEIRLGSGETRRFPMAEVDYAGPDKTAPAAPPPTAPLTTIPTTPPPAPSPQTEEQPKPRSKLSFVANEPGVVVKSLVSQTNFEGHGWSFGWGNHVGGPVLFSGKGKTYANVCAAPCEAEVPKGEQTLAVSYEGRKPIDVPLIVRGPSKIQIDYTSNLDVRVAGLVIGIASVGGGIAAAVVGHNQGDINCGQDSAGSYRCRETERDYTMIGVGLGVALVGGIVGTIMALTHDEAKLTVAPPESKTAQAPSTTSARADAVEH
ncbi:hypothetical protein LVJ94_11555 [Pendulispora rubella]|uniref:Uncharacterized protein n=1 Tax=Pendulispora rubella TaxID=2741070 RepID=A0ABZ2LAS1_9BACT